MWARGPLWITAQRPSNVDAITHAPPPGVQRWPAECKRLGLWHGHQVQLTGPLGARNREQVPWFDRTERLVGALGWLGHGSYGQTPALVREWIELGLTEMEEDKTVALSALRRAIAHATVTPPSSRRGPARQIRGNEGVLIDIHGRCRRAALA